MAASWGQRIVALLAVLFISLPRVLAIDSPPPLSIAWNPSAKANNWNVFGIHATYPEDTEFDDATIVGLAQQAFNEMRSTTDYNSMTNRPATVAALWVENELFISSSITGHGPASFVYDWLTPGGQNSNPSLASQTIPSAEEITAESFTDIESQLLSCRIQQMQKRDEEGSSASIGLRHRTKGNCAEVMALHMYNVVHPPDGLSNIGKKGAVIVAWGVVRGEQRVLDGCGSHKVIPTDWGCRNLMDSVGVRQIEGIPAAKSKGSTEYPLGVDQPNICERNPFIKA